MLKTICCLIALAWLPLVADVGQAGAAPGQGGAISQRPRAVSGGTEIVSPSVLATSSTRRDESGRFVVDLLILWRGSPGWSYRRSNLGGGSSMGSSSHPFSTADFTVDQGGLHLTASYDPASHSAVILGERVDLERTNVIFVDRVDSPDGPVIAGTMAVPPMQATPWMGAPHHFLTLLRDTPELLDYLRCEAQLPEPMNRPAIDRVCTEAIALGLVTAPRTVTPVPVGPVANRAAAVAPASPRQPPPGPSQSGGSGSSIISPTVVAGWFTSQAGAATRLDLLVLWRGSLGWALKGPNASSAGGGMPGSRRGMTINRGDRSLYAAFDAASHTAQIEDETIPLGDHNVVLVDDVDAERGPRVVKTLRVDPELPDARRVDQVIARSPELVAYLRCDLTLPDARQQAMMDVICGRFTGK